MKFTTFIFSHLQISNLSLFVNLDEAQTNHRYT